MSGKKLLLPVLVSALIIGFLLGTGCETEGMKEYQVEIQVAPEEAGDVSGEGTFEKGEKVTVEALPKDGYEFIAWEKKEDQLSTDKIHEFEISGDKALKAAFDKQAADCDLDYDFPEELEQLLVNKKADKIEGGSLDLGKVLDKEKRGFPLKLNSVTHLVVEDEFIDLEEMISMRQLDKEAPILAEQLEKANIKWYYNGKRLFSIEELYSALEEDWSKIICPTILEYRGVEGYLGDNPEEASPHHFKGIGEMKISPSEDKIAFGLNNAACPFRIGSAGIINLKDEEVYFTNIGWGNLALEKKWSPDEEHIAYISSSDGPSGDWLHVDNIKKKENMTTLDVEKINPVLEKEGYNTLHPQEPCLLIRDMSWLDDGSVLKFNTDFTYAMWEEGKESELKDIQWLFCVETKELKIERVIKNNS